jgi:hypothetical protein
VVEVVTGTTTKTVTSTGLGINGEQMFVVTSVTTADGGTVTNAWDMNGDGVSERVQRITTVVNGVGERTETVEEWHGASIARGVKDSRTVTVTSTDSKQVTISRDHHWGCWFAERETQTTLGNGKRAVLVEMLPQDGSVISTTRSSMNMNWSIQSGRSTWPSKKRLGFLRSECQYNRIDFDLCPGARFFEIRSLGVTSNSNLAQVRDVGSHPDRAHLEVPT